MATISRGRSRIIAAARAAAAGSEGGGERFTRLLTGAVTAGFAALLAVVVSAGIIMVLNQRHAGSVGHTYEVERQVAAIRLSLARMEAADLPDAAGTAMRADRAAAPAAMARAIARINALTADNPLQQARMPMLRFGAARVAATMSAGGIRALEDAAALDRVALAMRAEEDRLLAIRTDDQNTTATRFYSVVGAAGMLLLVVGGAVMLAIRRYTIDLGASRDALRGIKDNLEVMVRERTVELQRANDEIQRFAYIVSHDLRSPLVNVMGFTAELETATRTLTALVDKAEQASPGLVDTDAASAAREDLPEAIRFIRSSTQKMDRLINAVLRLSREGRRTMTPERIDMGMLARTIADGMQHRIGVAGAAIRIDPDLPAIVSDRLAIEQILSNLVENAVKYLQPGRPGIIDLRGWSDGARIVFEVADNGRGIDPRDHQRVFDLFRRSGMQDQPGEGIGLAHVRALAYRLGGTISLESTLGAGAAFRLNLPAVFAAEQGRPHD